MTARRGRRLQRLAGRLRPHVRGVCRCPACDKAEQRLRAQLGMPRLHPERIIARPPRPAEEALLDSIAAALWPDDEDAAIILEFRQEDQP